MLIVIRNILKLHSVNPIRKKWNKNKIDNIHDNIYKKTMHKLPGKLFLAPMAETSTPALRHVIKEFYPDTVLFSEMLSAGAIAARAPNNEPLIEKHDFDKPFIYQIVGANPAVMADACEVLAEKGCYAIDINMGCPNHDIVKKGHGAKLLTDPPKARDVVRACRRATATKLSVKMRSGYDDNDERHFVDFISMLESEGIDFITIHPRFARLGFRRTADWRMIELSKKHVSIPIIGNGDIDSPESAVNRLRETGCDGIMIGREAVRSPWIFKLTGDLLGGISKSIEIDMRTLFIKVLTLIKEYLPERLHKSRGHRFSAYFANNARYGHDLFTKIRNESSIEGMQRVVADYYLRNVHESIKNIGAETNH